MNHLGAIPTLLDAHSVIECGFGRIKRGSIRLFILQEMSSTDVIIVQYKSRQFYDLQIWPAFAGYEDIPRTAVIRIETTDIIKHVFVNNILPV